MRGSATATTGAPSSSSFHFGGFGAGTSITGNSSGLPADIDSRGKELGGHNAVMVEYR